MLPNNGNIYDLKVSYEFNYFMDGFSLDEEYGTYGSVLKPAVGTSVKIVLLIALATL